MAQKKAREDVFTPEPHPSTGLPANFWEEVSGEWEVVRRVSNAVYRRKANIVRNERKLNRHVKGSVVTTDGVSMSAAEWQSNIPPSNVATLGEFLVHLRYVLKGLADILKVYGDVRLRWVSLGGTAIAR